MKRVLCSSVDTDHISDVREVAKALNELAATNNSLSVLLASVAERLATVVRPEMDDPSIYTIPRAYESELAQSIHLEASRVESNNAWLRSLLERLEL